MNTQIKYDIETDVIVIGSGFAGLSAAIEAKNAGVDVLIFEKMKAIGGNSIISDGGIAAPETKLQKDRLIKDSKELMYQDIMKSGLELNNKHLVRLLVDQSKEAFDWSIHYLKVPYLNRVDRFGGHSVARCYTADKTTGATIIKKQVEKISDLGIKDHRQMYFKSYIFDDFDRVCGAIFRNGYEYNDTQKGEDVYVKANKGVIIATGGFSSDVSFRTKYDSRLTNLIDTTNKPFATAEAIIESMRIGADTVDMNFIQLGPWACPDEKGYGVGPIFSEYIVFQYGMIIDPETGNRFVNELADRKVLSDKMLAIGHPCIAVADAAAVKYSGWDITPCLKKGIVLTFDTVEKLARYYHIPEGKIQHTIKTFNEGITQGEDTAFHKPVIEGAGTFAKAPFYAMRLWPKVHHTMGGLKITPTCEVVSTSGDVIPGLYAAGEVTGGVHGASRLGSCAISECLVFGRIAGRNAAGNE
ncbi:MULTISPECIES: flavocytochrome c [unclassified Fusibacter]|uniref:FAD-dependent oxidoreductase n=1 Tax=unclassified Fusibacter TaxID=2624464 RepID=UPI0013E928F7|nr:MULTISPECIES: flavocytochrome c [unclassified Fusibacter]MCK8060315.1 flavocytochrome c [Fusibacter sp. A2]NPE20396.1 flavocytochrome c [Fusibacter sp. A1]